MQNDQQAARKAAVYEAALQLIGQGVSPAALKIQQLADAAGIGKGYEFGPGGLVELDAAGMPEMVKYLLSSSNVAEQPPRRAQTTLAPTFIVLSNDEI